MKKAYISPVTKSIALDLGNVTILAGSPKTEIKSPLPEENPKPEDGPEVEKGDGDGDNIG